jgi:hypothetical protein
MSRFYSMRDWDNAWYHNGASIAIEDNARTKTHCAMRPSSRTLGLIPSPVNVRLHTRNFSLLCKNARRRNATLQVSSDPYHALCQCPKNILEASWTPVNLYSVSTQLLKKRIISSQKHTSQKITLSQDPVASSPRIFYTIAGESRRAYLVPRCLDSTHDAGALMHLLPHQDLFQSMSSARLIGGEKATYG